MFLQLWRAHCDLHKSAVLWITLAILNQNFTWRPKLTLDAFRETCLRSNMAKLSLKNRTFLSVIQITELPLSNGRLAWHLDTVSESVSLSIFWAMFQWVLCCRRTDEIILSFQRTVQGRICAFPGWLFVFELYDVESDEIFRCVAYRTSRRSYWLYK